MITRHPSPRIGSEGDVLVQRIVAYLIDGLILNVILAVILGPAFVLGVLLLEVAEVLGFLIWMGGIGLWLAVVVYYSFLMEGHLGRTVGKAAMGLVVVGEDGSQCTYVQSILRNLLWIVDGLGVFPLVVALIVFITDRNQRVGDIVAKTVVVRAEGGR